MEYRRFGRTALQVSIVGIGTGGPSRLGMAYGATEKEAVGLIHRSLELGVNYLDTARDYYTERVIGRALTGHRDEIVLSSKVRPVLGDGVYLNRADLRSAVDRSLTKLQTGVIDVFHLHRVTKRSYDHAVNVLVPVLMELREEGKIRFIGLSESSGGDAAHSMLQRAVQDGCWDVIMASFNLFNQSARSEIFPVTREKDLAIEIMSSARSQFSNSDLLIAEIERLIASGELSSDQINRIDPLDFLRIGDSRITLSEASYRFAAHEPGVHVVLVGTGKITHLEENVAALNRGPLPAEIHERLVSMFGHLRAQLHVPGRILDLD